MTKQLVKTKIDGKYVTFGNIQHHEKGPRLGLRMTAQFKKMVAEAELDSWLNYLIFNDDRGEASGEQ
jgi:hypothetical protein